MIVVDASMVVDALVGDPANPAVIDQIAKEDLHAPTLLDFEVTSALRGHALAGRVSDMRLQEAIGDYLDLRIHRHPMTQSLPALLDLRENFTVYDAAYVLLAGALQVPLVTADAKLQEARRLGVVVEVVGSG